MGVDSTMSKKIDKKELMKKYRYFKPSDVNASFLRKIFRHLGGQLALKLEHTKITPNQLTILSFIFVLISIILFYLKEHLFLVAGAVSLFISMVLDKADGSLARLKNQGSKLGVWLDSTTDNLEINLLIAIIALVVYQKTGEWITWVLALSTIASYQASKLLYLYFKKYFSFANQVIDEEKRKHSFRSIFYYNEYFFFNLVIIAALLNIFHVFLIFCAIYGWVFYFGMYFILTKKAAKLNRKMGEEEELTSK